MTDRTEPPEGYRLHAPRPSAVPSGWWVAGEGLADHLTGKGREECVAAAWKHAERQRAIGAADWKARAEKAEALLRELATDMHESVVKGWVQLAPETQAALNRARAHLNGYNDGES